jgi:hypothetical protein
MKGEDALESSSRPGPDSAIKALRKKAHAALADAKALQEHGSPEATINRGYTRPSRLLEPRS